MPCKADERSRPPAEKRDRERRLAELRQTIRNKYAALDGVARQAVYEHYMSDSDRPKMRVTFRDFDRELPWKNAAVQEAIEHEWRKLK